MSLHGLFRPEVAEARRTNWLGSVSIGLPPSARVLTVVVIVVLALLVALLALGQYPRREIVRGSVVAIDGYALAISPFAGVVEHAFVREGQSVQRGEPMFRLSRRKLDASGSDLQPLLAASLSEKLSRLSSDQADLDVLQQRQREQVLQEIDNLEQQQRQLATQLEVRQQQVAIAKELLARLERLSQTNAISRLDIAQQRYSALESMVGFEQLQERRIVLERDLQSARARLAALPLEFSARSSDIARAAADVEAELTRLRFDHETVVRAPIDGTVVNIRQPAHACVDAGMPMAGVIGTEAALAVELWIPSRAMGRVRRDAEVFVRYEAYPSQVFGGHRSRIRELSPTAFSADEVSRLRGAETAEPMFRATAELPSNAIRSSRGEHGTLRPGMTVQADVFAERLALYRWIIRPFASADGTANPQARR